MGCCGDNPNEACGYPPKTIRATISIMIVLFSFMIFGFLAVFLTLKEQWTQAMAVLSVVSAELGGVLGYYFGSRSKEEVKDEVQLEMGRLVARLRESSPSDLLIH